MIIASDVLNIIKLNGLNFSNLNKKYQIQQYLLDSDITDARE